MTPAEFERYRALARPDEVLTDPEREREEDFVRLFAEQLRRLGGDGPSWSVVAIIAARTAASAVWSFDRLANRGKHYSKRVAGAHSAHLARKEEFADTDTRSRLRKLLLDEMSQAESLVETAGDDLVAATPNTQNRGRVT